MGRVRWLRGTGTTDPGWNQRPGKAGAAARTAPPAELLPGVIDPQMCSCLAFQTPRNGFQNSNTGVAAPFMYWEWFIKQL